MQATVVCLAVTCSINIVPINIDPTVIFVFYLFYQPIRKAQLLKYSALLKSWAYLEKRAFNTHIPLIYVIYGDEEIQAI